MGLRVNKKIGLGGGFSLNIGKNGVSVSKKLGNTTITRTQNGDIKGTVGIPGSGISYSETLKKKKK